MGRLSVRSSLRLPSLRRIGEQIWVAVVDVRVLTPDFRIEPLGQSSFQLSVTESNGDMTFMPQITTPIGLARCVDVPVNALHVKTKILIACNASTVASFDP